MGMNNTTTINAAEIATSYVIRVTRQYYGSSKKTSTLQDEYGCDHVFASRKAAKAEIAEREEGPYHTSHNESGRPTYRIVAR